MRGKEIDDMTQEELSNMIHQIYTRDRLERERLEEERRRLDMFAGEALRGLLASQGSDAVISTIVGTAMIAAEQMLRAVDERNRKEDESGQNNGGDK